MLHFRVFAIAHPPRTPDFFSGLTPIPHPQSPNSFACHTSEKSPSKSNHCHTSKFAKNNSFSCHTSETPRRCILSNQISDDRLRSFFLLPSRDEKPVTATSLKSVLTNCDARKSFRIRFYENSRVSPAFFFVSALFSPRASDNSFLFKGISTLSKNSRVYGSPSASVNSALSVGSALVPILSLDFQLSTFNLPMLRMSTFLPAHRGMRYIGRLLDPPQRPLCARLRNLCPIFSHLSSS